MRQEEWDKLRKKKWSKARLALGAIAAGVAVYVAHAAYRGHQGEGLRSIMSHDRGTAQAFAVKRGAEAQNLASSAMQGIGAQGRAAYDSLSGIVTRFPSTIRDFLSGSPSTESPESDVKSPGGAETPPPSTAISPSSEPDYISPGQHAAEIAMSQLRQRQNDLPADPAPSVHHRNSRLPGEDEEWFIKGKAAAAHDLAD